MSLTSCLRDDKNFREIIKPYIKKENIYTFSGKRPFSTEYKLLCENKTKAYPLIGTAFDYCIRAYIAHYSQINTENACERIYAKNKKYKSNWKVKRKIKKHIKTFQNFILEKKLINDNCLIDACIGLAEVDIRLRSPRKSDELELLQPNFYESQKETENAVKLELKELLNLFLNSELFNSIFTAKNILYNPAFLASNKLCFLVHGADADLIVDNIIYDFKTTKNRGYKWTDFAQILLYAYMAQQDYRIKIEKIAIYKARFNEIEYLNYNEINIENLVDKLIKYMEKAYKKQNDYYNILFN